MFKLTPHIKSIGLEKTSQSLKIAEVKYSRGSALIEDLTTVPLEADLNVKRFYKHQPLLTTGIEGYEVLLRNLYLPLSKEKDIQEALVFQAEPLLPYPVEQALLSTQTLNQSPEGTALMLVSLKKQNLQTHLDQWQQFHIEPEKVACLQMALCHFAKTYVGAEKVIILVHVQEASMTAVLVSAGKLMASFSQQEGLNLLYSAIAKDLNLTGEQKLNQKTLQDLNFSSLDEQKFPYLREAILKLKRNTTKMYFALVKELKGAVLDGVLLTGDGTRLNELADCLLKDLPSTQIVDHDKALTDKFSFKDLLVYAMPIGLALNSLPSEKESMDFRQSEYSYSKPFKRAIKPLVTYFVGMFVLSALLYFFSHDLLKIEENSIKQNYIDLLAGMGKTFDQFETIYRAKNADEGEYKSVLELNREDLYTRLAFMEKDIQSTPDSFPLFANVPRVSDVLSWLSTHPAVIGDEESGESEGKLFLENFSYNLIRRPEQAKKQEKYQVKVELEFSTVLPRLAREFHDALITPNNFVDPKAEIKWNANRNNYKTSFYLKDKTSYL